MGEEESTRVIILRCPVARFPTPLVHYLFLGGRVGKSVCVVVRGVGGLVGSACMQLAVLGVNYEMKNEIAWRKQKKER